MPNMTEATTIFINQEHEDNFFQTLEKWEKAKKGDREYASACYILALPMIFEKFNITKMRSPVQWIINWEIKFDDDAAEEYGVSEEEREDIVIEYDLTGSMAQLGRLALHLWNGYTQFHLLDCIGSLDNRHRVVAYNAIKMRCE
ncbi:MAG: DUF2538 family protein [Kurthia sp.]|nr:DUF2538 family protein [Candidatus Kurthia equi]